MGLTQSAEETNNTLPLAKLRAIQEFKWAAKTAEVRREPNPIKKKAEALKLPKRWANTI